VSSISPIYIEDDGDSAWHDIDVDLDEQSQRDFDTLEPHYKTLQFEVPSRAVLEDQFAKADLLAMSRALRKQWLQVKAQWLEAIGSVSAKLRAMNRAYSGGRTSFQGVILETYHSVHPGHLWVLVPIGRLAVSRLSLHI
jgi:hypothetical protein